MKEGFEAFKATIDLTQYALSGYQGLLVFNAHRHNITILMQSSHASLVLILTALSASQITYENAIALNTGAKYRHNYHGGHWSLGASLRANSRALTLINTVTGLILVWFVPQFIILIDYTAPLLGHRCG